MSKIQITCDTDNAEIYMNSIYDNFSELVEEEQKRPNANLKGMFDLYTSPFYNVKDANSKIEAIAVKEGLVNSDVAVYIEEDNTPLKFPTPIISSNTLSKGDMQVSGNIYIDNLKEIFNTLKEGLSNWNISDEDLQRNFLEFNIKVENEIYDCKAAYGYFFNFEENLLHLDDSFSFTMYYNWENLSSISISFKVSTMYVMDQCLWGSLDSSTSLQIFEDSDYGEIILNHS